MAAGAALLAFLGQTQAPDLRVSQFSRNKHNTAAPAYAPARGAEPLPDATAPLAFLECWSEPDKACFYRFVAEQEALFKDLPLPDLNAKVAEVARQFWLTVKYTDDRCYVRFDGTLTADAQLRATLLALLKCIPAATLEAQAVQVRRKGSRFREPQLTPSSLRFRCRPTIPRFV